MVNSRALRHAASIFAPPPGVVVVPALTRDGRNPMAKGENSFDVACKVDPQAVADAVHQATREIADPLRPQADQDRARPGEGRDRGPRRRRLLLKQVRRPSPVEAPPPGCPAQGAHYGKVEPAAGGTVRQRIDVQQGIPMDKAKEIVRLSRTRSSRCRLRSRRTTSGSRARTGRPPGRDQDAQGSGPRDRDAVHQLPLGVAQLEISAPRPTPSARPRRRPHRSNRGLPSLCEAAMTCRRPVGIVTAPPCRRDTMVPRPRVSGDADRARPDGAWGSPVLNDGALTTRGA